MQTREGYVGLPICFSLYGFKVSAREGTLIQNTHIRMFFYVLEKLDFDTTMAMEKPDQAIQVHHKGGLLGLGTQRNSLA
jgi:hypothetical protein